MAEIHAFIHREPAWVIDGCYYDAVRIGGARDLPEFWSFVGARTDRHAWGGQEDDEPAAILTAFHNSRRLQVRALC